MTNDNLPMPSCGMVAYRSGPRGADNGQQVKLGELESEGLWQEALVKAQCLQIDVAIQHITLHSTQVNSSPKGSRSCIRMPQLTATANRIGAGSCNDHLKALGGVVHHGNGHAGPHCQMYVKSSCSSPKVTGRSIDRCGCFLLHK